MQTRKIVALALAGLVVAGASQALPVINEPVPSSAYITFNGLQWAWASAVAADGSFNPENVVDLSYQGSLGWRLPTAREMLGAPLATDFMFVGANVPYLGSDPVTDAFFNFTQSAGNGPTTLTGDAACAIAYFNTSRACGWGNAPGSSGERVVPWWGQAGAMPYSESLAVRAVPEFSTSGLLVLGLVGIGVAARRRKA